MKAILELLQHGNQLKRTLRTGWAQRGIPQPENVAAHSYGVAYTALILAQIVEEPLDLGRLLAMALLHDLPEAVTTDIPPSVWRYLPEGSKYEAEKQVLADMLAGLSFGPDLQVLWAELQADATAEARLVHDADKLELYLQAANYAAETGSTRLSEFWQPEPAFHFPQVEALYQALRAAGWPTPSED